MINTHEELLQKLKEYESKWGKLGHTNIMRPELNHTGLKGGSKMLKMDNEYYEFRRKVAEGSKKNRLAHASTISPDELNERYEQELIDRGSLIHAANGMKGQQLQNTKYYKREGEPGHYRYYYTKEEWDAAHRSPESSENKANAHKQNIAPAQEPAKDTKNFIHNAQADSVKKYAEIAKKSPKAAAEEIVKNNDMGLEDMFREIEEAFKSGSIKWNKDNLVPGENGDDEFVKAKEWIEEASIAAEKFCKDIDKSAGTGGDTFRAVRDLVRGRVNEMAEKYATKPMEKKVTKDNIKHSADETSSITSSAIGDEIIDEYKAFQEKVKAGTEKHRLAHSSFISPEELNAKYQEELENNRILCHTTNYKYYNKIDLGNGQTRYFYTKAEWDAYQRGEDGKKQDEFKKQQAQKKVAEDRNNMSGYEEWKKNQSTTQKKNTSSSDVSKDIQNYNDTLNQVKEADRSLNVQVAQNMREEAIKNSKVQSEPNTKPSELAVALKQILDDSKTLKVQEAQNKREEAIKKSQEAGKEADRINKINNDYKNTINENVKLSSEIDKKYDFDDIKDEDDLKECWRDLLGDIREIKDNVDNPDKVRYDISENNENYSAYIDEYLKKEIKLNNEIETAFRKSQNARNYDESKRYGDEWTKLNKEKEYLVKEHKTKVYNYINNLYKELLK